MAATVIPAPIAPAAASVTPGEVQIAGATDNDTRTPLTAGRCLRAAGPWTTSAAVHFALVAVLAIWMLSEILIEPYSHQLLLEQVEPGSDLSMAAAAANAESGMPAMASISSSAETESDSYGSIVPPELARLPTPLLASAARSDGMPRLGSAASQLQRDVSRSLDPAISPQDGISRANNVVGALENVLGSIEDQLSEEDLLVVWLFDASLSLVDDRQMITERIVPFYEQMLQAHRAGQCGELRSAVVCFGNSHKEMLGPKSYGKVPDAVLRIPIDQTGMENVMTAVTRCVNEYRKRWKQRMMIVVWTDESGDDILALEDTIALCRQEYVPVWVVGPTSVLGSERGTHKYTDPRTLFSYLLPVKRGPDTALPERVMLPYWFGPDRKHFEGGIVPDMDVPFFGGPHREGVMSGFGPYALTRLALLTGGRFQLLDPAGEETMFDLATMMPYVPDYVSARSYMEEVEKSPLRQAVSYSAIESFAALELLMQPPPLSFNGGYSDVYPFAYSLAGYQSPASFRGDMKDTLRRQAPAIQQTLALIERLLKRFDDVEPSRYDHEGSRRWQAWYDLNYGRLLAQSVRYREYLTVAELLTRADALHPETNRVVLSPHAELRTGEESVNRARKAAQLLQKCADRNPRTPWFWFATWEMEHEMGLYVNQFQIPRPPPMPAVPVGPARPAGPAPSFPRL